MQQEKPFFASLPSGGTQTLHQALMLKRFIEARPEAKTFRWSHCWCTCRRRDSRRWCRCCSPIDSSDWHSCCTCHCSDRGWLQQTQAKERVSGRLESWDEGHATTIANFWTLTAQLVLAGTATVGTRLSWGVRTSFLVVSSVRRVERLKLSSFSGCYDF